MTLEQIAATLTQLIAERAAYRATLLQNLPNQQQWQTDYDRELTHFHRIYATQVHPLIEQAKQSQLEDYLPKLLDVLQI